MRISFKMPVMVLILVAVASSLYAQGLPGMAIDSSFRVEYQLANLINRLSEPTNPAFRFTPLELRPADQLNIDLVPQFALLSGVVEVSPFPSISGRLAGSLSVAEGSAPTRRVIHPLEGNTRRWNATPDFSSWEAAGLYHLWNAAGYRFSFTAGYRNEKWIYNGQPDIESNGSLHDEYTSYIPFIGLQTSMLFPWWKARFEVLGSPFMNRKFLSTLGNHFRGTGNANGGGLLEFQMEGSVSVTPSLFLGINACYSYQELYGAASVAFPQAAAPNTSDYRLYMTESLFRIGFDVNILF